MEARDVGVEPLGGPTPLPRKPPQPPPSKQPRRAVKIAPELSSTIVGTSPSSDANTLPLPLPASSADNRHRSVATMHPTMFDGIPITPMDINDTPLIAWRLTLAEDTQVMCTISASLVSSDGFTWTALLGGTKWSRFPEQYRQIIEQSNSSSQDEVVETDSRRSQLYFAAFHAFQAGVSALPVGNYSVSKRLLDVSGRPCAAETYAWKVVSWFGRRTYIADVAGAYSIEPHDESSLNFTAESAATEISAIESEHSQMGLSEANPTRWTVDDVCSWLSAERLKSHIKTFLEHDIDGEMLFEIDEEMLRVDLGVTSKLEIRKILTKRNRLEKSTQSMSLLDSTFVPRTVTLQNMVSESDLRKLEDNTSLEVLRLDLRRGQFSLDQARELVDMLELNTSVTSLSFVALGNGEARLLSDALRSTPQIREVRLVENCEVTDPAVVQIIYDRTWLHEHASLLRSVAANHPNITEIDCSNCALGNDVAIRLGRALRPNTVLRKFTATGNFFGTAGLENLYEVLSGKENLEVLQLVSSSRPIQEQSLPESITSTGLTASEQLRLIDACGMKDGDENLTVDAFKSIMEELNINISDSSWVRLEQHLVDNKDSSTIDYAKLFSDPQMISKPSTKVVTKRAKNFCDANHGCFTLLPTVDQNVVDRIVALEQIIRDTSFQKEKKTVFQQLAMNNPDCYELRWGDKCLGDTIGVKIAKTIKGNMYLRHIELQGNNFSPGVVNEIVDSLQSLDEVNHLVLLPMPGIKEQALISILAEMEQQTKDRSWCRENLRLLSRLADNGRCTSLDCSNLKLGDNVALEIAQALHTNSTVTTLNISGNCFGEAGVRALLTVLKQNRTLTQLTWIPQSPPMPLSSDTISSMRELERSFQQIEVLKKLVTNDSSLMRLDKQHFKQLTFQWLTSGPLAFNTSVIEIDISTCSGDFNSTSSRNSKALLQLLASNRTIKSVVTGQLKLSQTLRDVLWSRTYCETFAAMLSRIISNDANMTEIVTIRGMGDRGANALTRAIRYNSSVQKVILSENFLSHNGSRELLSILTQSSISVELVEPADPALRREIQALVDKRWCSRNATFLKHISTSDIGVTEVEITDENIGDVAAHRLADALKKNSNILKFKLTGTLVQDCGITFILDALRQKANLQELELLPNKYICNRHVLARINSMQHRIKGRKILQLVADNDPGIKIINWANKGIDDDMACAIADALRGSIHVLEVNLSGNTFGNTGAEALLESISSSKSIVKLALVPADHVRSRPTSQNVETRTHVPITLYEQMLKLEQEFRDREWLSENKDVLDSVAANNTSVTDLREMCSGEGFGDVAALQLIEALHGRPTHDGHSATINSAVTILDVAYNRITAKSARAILEVAKSMPNLAEFVMLPNPAINDKQLVSEIEIEQQRIHDRSWCKLAENFLSELAVNSATVTKINWSNRGLGDVAVSALLGALEGNNSVVSIDLSNNAISNKGARQLLTHLQEKTAISEVVLLPNRFIDDIEIKGELKMMNSLLSTKQMWERPRGMPSIKLPIHVDGNSLPFLWNAENDRPRSFLDDWEPFDTTIDGEAAWDMMPMDVIRFDKVLPHQDKASSRRLSPQAMQRRRDQLTVRLSRYVPNCLHNFSKLIEANQNTRENAVDLPSQIF